MNSPNFRPALLSAAIVLGLAACSQQQAPEAAAPASPVAAAPAPLSIDTSGVPAPIRFQASDLDSSIRACDHFGNHVNSRWLASNPIPGDRTTWGAFPALGERSLAIQHEIAKVAAADPGPQGEVRNQVGNFFKSGMDEAAIEAAGITPIQSELDAIAALSSGSDVAEYLRQRYARGTGMLFAFYGSADIKDSTTNIAYAMQGGLSLPERAYYLEDREDYQKARSAFLDHVAKLLVLAGGDAEQAKTQAEQVLAFETELAKASLARLELRDPANRYNPVDLATADALTPNFSWTALFNALEVPAPSMFSLAMTDFFKQVDSMLANTPVDQWQTWLRFKTIDAASPYLSSAFEEQNFDFYRRTLAGQKEQQERWKRVLNAVNGGVGEGLGQLYVEVAFPPESKAKMEQLVDNLRAALKVRLENLSWMGDETKTKALEKWSTFTPKIGYPDKWRSWDGLDIQAGDYLGNVQRAAAFNYRFNLDKIGKPVDRSEWGMSPQTVNAYYRSTANEIVFPAAILQPPFFDAEADDALNYGGIGAVIGHEMLHGYDDQGSKFDAQGNFSNWWTDEDRARFEKSTAKLADQYSSYEALPGMFVNGKLGLGENIADLGGVTVALDALHRSQADGFEDPMVEGLSQDQRFFMNWATVWRINYTEEQLKVQLTVGPHSPGTFRAYGPAQNIPHFAKAFDCADADPMIRAGEERVTIW